MQPIIVPKATPRKVSWIVQCSQEQCRLFISCNSHWVYSFSSLENLQLKGDLRELPSCHLFWSELLHLWLYKHEHAGGISGAYRKHFFTYHIYTNAQILWFGGGKCVKIHKLCVIYTFLGWREALVDHRCKSQITFTHVFLIFMVVPPPNYIYIYIYLYFSQDVKRPWIHHHGNWLPLRNHQWCPPHWA